MLTLLYMYGCLKINVLSHKRFGIILLEEYLFKKLIYNL